MSTPKGYSTQEKDDRLRAQFTTVEPVREKQYGLTVLSHTFVYQVGTDAVEASSSTSVINATAHAAKVGDIIRFTSGALSGQEVKVASVTTNTITLAETLPSAPALAVTFQILRHKYPLINSDGSIPLSVTPTAIEFTKNGVDVTVNEDTVTPANNRPLPVKLMGTTGPINITAGDLNVQLSDVGANYDATRIGDGTTLLGITLSNEAKVSDSTAQTTLSAISAKLPATLGQKASAASLAVVVASDQSAIPISAASLPLPTGASTEATLAAMSAKLPATLGQKAMAASFAVAIASDQSAIPASQSGTWNINNVSGTVSLPTGASTSALQTTGNTSLSSIDGKFNSLGQKASAASAPVVIASDQSAIPVSQSGTWNVNNVSGTVSLPTGASTLGEQQTQSTTLSAISGKLPATLGQKVSASSLAVVVASDQSAIPASQSGTWNITNVSGTVSLPTGAATETTLAAMSAKLPATLGQKAMAASFAVAIASDQSAVPSSQSGTWNITNVSGTVSLPTGAATAANQTTANTSLASIDGKLPTTLGQKTSANSLAVVIASDQSAVSSKLQDGSGTAITSVASGSNRALHTSQAGRAAITLVRNDYSSVNVTTGAYTQLVASTSAEVHEVEIFDSSGQTLFLATGAAASEVNQVYIFPGGNGRIPLRIASGTRVSIKAVSATASAGEISINFYGG